ncbi:transglycosylase SLT domain-containing protein [Aliarcobacter vitoriensis]|uniref:lytic transglycosylase domain-containing protein n=1 Tax=Aliarcobacter vitoriensis TaxID=2011099 RepID=UPI003AAAC319
MKKIFFIVLFLTTLIYSNSFQNEDIKVLDEIGVPKEFLKESSFLLKYKDLSSQKKIRYYDNIIKKSILNAKIVREELEYEKMPSFLFFVPLIESSYVNQISKKGPSGLWQIMPLTATNLKLRRNDFVDERLDLIKSTQAATSYLQKYYKKFGEWYLSVLAYNAGEGRIIHGLARASLDNYLEKNPTMYHDKVIKLYNIYINDYRKSKKGIDNLFTIYRDLGKKNGHFDYMYLMKHNNKRDYLPKTSINYINTLVAFSILANNDKFKNLDKNSRYELEKITASKGLRLKTISDAISMDYNELKGLNKHLLKEVIPTDKNNYNLYIPHTKSELFNLKLTNIKNLVATDEKVVVSKDTKQEVAKKSLSKANKTIHIVKQGDTLEAISKKYKVSVKKIKSDNKKKTNMLKIGEKIEIYK